jgi:Ca-activated chloride channel homolog
MPNLRSLPLAGAIALSLTALLAGCNSRSGPVAEQAPQPQARGGTDSRQAVSEAPIAEKKEVDALYVEAAADAAAPAIAAPPQTVGTLALAPVPVGNVVSRATPAMAAAPSSELVVDAETYAHTAQNPIHQTSSEPVSTFSVDVDTGSYTNTRRMLLTENRLPPADAVRPEEFINYFDYGYPQPSNRSQPFSVTTELAAAPWNAKRELLLVGLKGFEMQKSEIPAANLVFLLDVSGSMDEPNKLPLLKASISQMIERMGARDRVSIVVYAGAAGVVLPPTPGNQQKTILAALEQLHAGGSTNGGEGIELAYQLATANKIAGGVNRIILATDGDFNVGQFDQSKLKEFVANKRDTGVSLSTLGFGDGNYNDAMAEQLADVGNGKYSYIDSLNEAKHVLGREIAGSLFTIASDVKVQIEFNPRVVSEYRLIGYDNRMLAQEDFNNDRVDAGDLGAGHSVTALYEITRVGAGGEALDALRYAAPATVGAGGNELAFLKLRYKLPTADAKTAESILISQAIPAQQKSSERLSYAAVVAGFAQHLQGGKYTANFTLSQMQASLSGLKQFNSADASELKSLIDSAERLHAGQTTEPVAIAR